MKTYDGKKHHVKIRRLYCKGCDHLHNELPSELLPNKHYSSDVIEAVISGDASEADPISDGGPSDSTMKRWRLWFRKNRTNIDGAVRSHANRFLGFGEDLLKSRESLLDQIMEIPGWLSEVLAIIYNTGGFLEPYRDWEYAPALL